MSFKKKIAILESQQEEIKTARKAIRKDGKLKKKNRNILYNLDNVLRRELDASPYQTIVTPGGLWIDYEPDLKKGKVERFYNEKVTEPFAKKYVRPDKIAMQNYMNDEFQVIYGEDHIATIEYTKFVEDKVSDDEKDSGLGFGNGIGKNWGGSLTDIPKSSMIQCRYYGYEENSKYSNQVHASSFAYKAGDKKLKKIGEEKAKSKYNWQLVNYDTYGNDKDLKGKGYMMYVLFYQEYLDKNDTSPAPEDVWTSYFGSKINIKGSDGNSYFVTWTKHLKMDLRTIVGNNKLFTQYLVYETAAGWLLAMEDYGPDKVLKIGGIPARNIKVWNKDDPEDVAYDGPIGEL